jgi:hypothetical protein
MPDPEKAVVAAAASEFLTRFGKPISAQYISGFLRHSNNFVTMCEHFDSLGHKFDRGDLARFLLDSVNREQIKQMDSVLPTSVPAHPLSQESKERGRVLGEVEDHQEQQQQESNSAARFLPHGPSTSVETYNVPIALCQVVPYSTHTQSSESANSLTPQRKSKKGGERVRTLPGSVPKWQRVNSAPPVVVTSAAVTRQLPGTVSASQPVSIPDNSPQALHRNSSPFSILSNNHPPLVIAHQQFPGRLFSTANLMNIQNEALRSSGTHQSIFGQSVSTPVCNFPIDNLAIVQDSPTNPVSLEGLNLPDTGQATVGEASGYENDLNPKELQSAEPSVAAPNIPTLSVQVPNDSIASATSESGRTGINNLAASPIAIFSGLPTTAGVGSIIIDLTTTLDSAVSTPEHAVNVTRKLQEFKQPLATMISRKKAARVTKYNPTDIARSILIVARKHPTERSLNSHLLELKENLPGHIDWNSDLETIRWDILDPDPVGVDDYINGDHEGDRNNSPISSEKSINGNGISTKPTLSILKKRRRGGPQRIRKSLLQDQMSQARPASTEIRLDHLTEQPAPQFTPSNATSSRRLQSNHNDSIHSPSRQTAVMESSPISKRRRTGQPTRLMQQNGANYTGNAVFKKYRCKWKDCNADLHNIENLKRHIINLHKGKNNNMESYPCYWMGCFRPQLNGVKAWKNRLHPMIWDFASERDWQNHVDRHVDTVKHAYGVGPAALFSGKVNFKFIIAKQELIKYVIFTIDQESGVSDVDYLSDHNGQQVTPMARQSNPSYKFVPPLGFRPTKQFKIAHGITTPDRRTTMASYRQTLERLRILGAGMEGDEVEELLVFDGGQGIHTESKRIVPASWPPKPRISTSVIT